MSIQLKREAEIIRKLRLLRAAKGNVRECVPLVVVLSHSALGIKAEFVHFEN